MAVLRGPERRRHPRARATWPVVIDTGGRRLHATTVNVSALGAKVRSHELFEPGSTALFCLRPEGQRALDVDALVWRVDADGVAFFFLGLSGFPGERHETTEAISIATST